jgi:magnesium-transporting ATPase (P-type)
MQVKTIVFDKTGTLTIGKPEVVSAVLLSEFSMEVLCDMAISVEVFFLCWILYLFGYLEILYSLINVFRACAKDIEEYKKIIQL